MPELPEVEHVKRALQQRIAGRSIVKAELRRRRLAPDISPRMFDKKIAGAKIAFVHRRGKHILIDLDNKRTLIVHLRMSGRFMHLTPDDLDPKFTHAVLHLDDESRLVFEDQRHFGLMKVVDTPKLYEAKELSKLAPEPFSDDFSAEYLAGVIRSSSRVIKEILLDQTKVCGVGNIYASEALFLSGINPKKRGKSIGRERCGHLFQNIRSVLNEALETGKSIDPHPTVIGEGVYGNGSETRWRVYDREGDECISCSSPIKRFVQGARSTYYCPKCQR